MKCLDTTFLIDLLRGKKALQRVSSAEACTTQINVYELLFGIYRRDHPGKQRQLQTARAFLNEVTILPLTDIAVQKAAEIAGELVLQGKEINQNDCMVAAIALTHGITVIVTQDVEHFERVPGVLIEKH